MTHDLIKPIDAFERETIFEAIALAVIRLQTVKDLDANERTGLHQFIGLLNAKLHGANIGEQLGVMRQRIGIMECEIEALRLTKTQLQ